MTFRGLLVLLCFCGFAQAARGQTQSDWPCKQVRVPEIALAGVWTGGPLDSALAHWRDDAFVAELVARIGARRTPIETAENAIADFARGAGDKRKERLTQLFAGVFERMNGERRDVVNGLDRFGRRLKEMAEDTRKDTEAMRALQDKTPADPEPLRKASEALQWRLRVFDEQRRMVSFVCESPALIEQRFGALARAILRAMD